MKTPIPAASPCRPGATLNTLIAGMLLLALTVAGVSVLAYEWLDTLLPIVRVGIILLAWILMLALFAAAITRATDTTLRRAIPDQTAPCR